MRKLLTLLGIASAIALFTPKALAVDPCCKYTVRYAPGSCYTATLNNGSITDGAEHIYNDGDWAEFTLFNCANNNCDVGMTVGYITGWGWVPGNPGHWSVTSGPYPLHITHGQYDVKFTLHGVCVGPPNCAAVVWEDLLQALPCFKDNCGN